MLRLKDIKEKYEVYRWNEYYTLHRKEYQPGDTSVHPYLCKFIFKKDKAILDNSVVCRNIEQFQNEVDSFISSLPYNSDNYNPKYRPGYFEELSFYDTFKDMKSGDGYNEDHYIEITNGFNNVKLSSYPNYDPEKKTVYINLEDFKFRYINDVDLEGAIKFAKEHIYICALTSVLSSYDILKKIGPVEILNETKINTVNLRSLDINSVDFKNHLIELAQKMIDGLNGKSKEIAHSDDIVNDALNKYPIFKDRIQSCTDLITKYAKEGLIIPEYFIKSINDSWTIVKYLSNGMMNLDAFKKYNSNTKWDISKYLSVEWKCPYCNAHSSPIRCEPFDGEEIYCDECDTLLTRRTGGGQSDPFNWIF